ncbi:MAG: HEAT repeat domain-containing protein, partial [Candidatus Aminicenantes bacterium]|nr:HEAT repeat domain-containing protein [Candidatus Aminicenantes bacterium]
LEILRMISTLPPEESDIVISLWERDFANIRYYAPDEFLETKIGVGMEPVKYRLDKNELSTGTIELAPEDKRALSQNDLLLETFEKTAEKPEDLIEKGEEFSPVVQSTSLNDEEAKTLELMLRSNRKISSEDELRSLLIEMLYLEERPEQFNITLNALAHLQKDLLLKGDFSRALQLFTLTLELKESLLPQFDEEAKLLENFLKDLSNTNSLASIKKVSQSGQVFDLKSFFDYLKLLGPEAIHLVGDLYEDSKDPGFRINALDYFKEVGQKNIAALMDIVHDNRPALATEIISLSSAFNDKRTIHYLANFISYKNKTIKFEAVKALGKFGDKAANTILMGFLADKDEGLRILAAQELQPSGDSSILDRIKQLVLNKKFIKKRRMEKKALLELLGRSQTEEACDMLRNIMKKISIFSLPKRIETSLCAVSALEVMQTPEAHKALDEGVHMRNKKISQACRFALKKISSKETSKNQVKEK